MTEHAREHFGWAPSTPPAAPEANIVIVPKSPATNEPEAVQETAVRSGGLGVPFRVPLLILGFASLASEYWPDSLGWAGRCRFHRRNWFCCMAR